MVNPEISTGFDYYLIDGSSDIVPVELGVVGRPDDAEEYSGGFGREGFIEYADELMI